MFTVVFAVLLGCHIVAPSDMMDGRIGAIKEVLHKNNLSNKVRYSILFQFLPTKKIE